MEVGGGGYRRDGYRYGGLIMWEDTVTNAILGTDPNNLLGYAPVLELHQPIMSMLGGNGFQLKRDNRITRIIFWIINSLFRKKKRGGESIFSLPPMFLSNRFLYIYGYFVLKSILILSSVNGNQHLYLVEKPLIFYREHYF